MWLELLKLTFVGEFEVLPGGWHMIFFLASLLQLCNVAGSPRFTGMDDDFQLTTLFEAFVETCYSVSLPCK